MGGRGSRSGGSSMRSVATAPVGDMTDRQLGAATSSVERRIAEAEEVLARTASSHVGYLQGAPWGSRVEHEEYERAYDELHGTLMPRRDALLAERSRRSGDGAATRGTFVNSYGEATDRYITSPTYESELRRRRREVDSFLGYGRR